MSETDSPSPGASAPGDIIFPVTPPKDPILVLVLNLLVAGGLGYILLGQKTKGIAAMTLCVAVSIPTLGAAYGPIALFCAIDGYLQAQQLQRHPLGQWTFFSRHR